MAETRALLAELGTSTRARWDGDDLLGLLAELRPKAPQRRQRADRPFDQLLDEAHPVPGAILIWQGARGERDAFRVALALLLAGWRGPAFLLGPAADPGPAWPALPASRLPRGRKDIEAALRGEAPLPSVSAIVGWGNGARDSDLLPPRPMAHPDAAWLLLGVVRGLLAGARARQWLRAAEWALDLGHPDLALTLTQRAARQTTHVIDVAWLHDLQGRVRGALGQLDRAERHLLDAVARWPDSERAARSQVALARVLRARGRATEARKLAQKAQRQLHRAFGSERAVPTAEARLELGLALLDEGDDGGARGPLVRGATALAALGARAEAIRGLASLARLQQQDGDFAAARAALVDAWQRSEVRWGPGAHPARADLAHRRGSLEHAAGHDEEASRWLNEASRQQDEALPHVHPARAATLHQRGAIAQARGDLGAARELLEATLAIEQELHGDRDHPSTAITELSLGVVLVRGGHVDDGVAALEHAAAVLDRSLGAEHPHTRHARGLLAAAAPGIDADPSVLTPFLLHALATTGGRSLPRELLARLTFRVLLRERAAPLVSVLSAADLASAEPGVLDRDPAALTVPPQLAARLQVPWADVLQPAVELHRQLHEALPRLLPATAGRVDPKALDELNELDDPGCMALVDLALSTAAAARKSGERRPVVDELELWTHAGGVALRVEPDGVGPVLARLLWQVAPEARDELATAWGLDEAARAALG